MGKKPLHALPHLVALGAQCGDFVLQRIGYGRLLGQLCLSLGGALLSFGTGQPLALDEIHGPQTPLFKGGEIVGTQSQGFRLRSLAFLLIFVLSFFGDPGFKSNLRH